MLTVHIISDSIGNTAKDVVKAALVQFSYSDARYKILKNSNVSTKERIESIVENIEKDDVVPDNKSHVITHSDNRENK